MRRLVKVLDPEEARKVLAVCERRAHDWCGQRNQALVGLMLFGGLRQGEARHVRVEDVRSGGVEIRASRWGEYCFEPKYGSQRSVVVPDELLELLVLVGFDRPMGESPYLMQPPKASSGIPLSRQGVCTLMSRLGEEAGLDRRLTAHMLRHTSATLQLRGGVDIRTVQENLGHRSLEATMVYTHVSSESKRASADVLKGMLDSP